MNAVRTVTERIEIENDQIGLRLDVWLSEELEMTRSQVKQAIQREYVKVNGEVVKAGTKLQAGHVVQVDIPEPEAHDVMAEAIPLNIVYEDEDIIVINKAAGMVVHPAAGHWTGTLVHALLWHCKDLSGVGGVIRPGIVHRLDKDTSGLLVVAKNDLSHQSLTRQIKERTMKRQYWALAHGKFKDMQGSIDAPVGRHPKDRKRMAIVENGRAAVTHYRVLESCGEWTLLECRLETGRTHQIRVHFAGIQHPLVGDEVYGWGRLELGAQRQMLHAQCLELRHPTSNEEMTFFADIPEDFRLVLEKARRSA